MDRSIRYENPQIFQQILDFVALPESCSMWRKLHSTEMKRDTSTTAPSHGITDLPDKYEWKAGGGRGGGGSVNGARDNCAKKRRKMKTKGCWKKEKREQKQESKVEQEAKLEENGRKGKEVKKEKARHVISGAYTILTAIQKKDAWQVN